MAQVSEQYVLNVKSGLPSNHVYITLRDKFGYLWMGTTKGVVKYNGYDLKLFDVSSGMASDDIWSLYEDKNGKIWLSTVSDEIGYIYENKYKTAYIPDASVPVYPKYVRENRHGIIFLSKYRIQSYGYEICFEKNDSVRCVTLMYPYYYYFYISKNKEMILHTRNKLFKIGFKNGHPAASLIAKNILNYNVSDSLSYTYSLFNSWFISTVPQNKLNFVNIETGEHREIKLANEEEIYTLAEERDNIILITNQNVYRFNHKIEKIETPSKYISNYDSLRKHQVVHFLDDSIWGKVFTTIGNGVYISRINSKFTKDKKIDLSGCSYVGNSIDTSYFWWNRLSHVLTCIKQNGEIVRLKDLPFSHVEKIIPYDATKSYILANNSIYTIENKSLIINDLLTKMNYCRQDFTNIGVINRPYVFPLLGFPSDGIVEKANFFYLISRSGFVRMTIRQDTVFTTKIDDNKYVKICHDEIHKTYWAYHSNRLLIYNAASGQKRYFSESTLKRRGIKKIEKILVDDFAQVYIKTHQKLFVYNYDSNKYKEVLDDYPFGDAQVYIYQDLLLIAGKQGIAYSYISPNSRLSKPQLLQNTKGILYNNVNDLHILNQTMYLNTDRGVYSLSLPAKDSKETKMVSQSYNFIITYNDSSRIIDNNEVIGIDQGKKVLNFDVVNPFGNGKLRFKYKIGNREWENISANELFLPQLLADRIYKLHLIAYDDVWQSEVETTYFYIIPYWWQTKWGIRFLWFSGIVVMLGFLYLIVYITRKVVNRQHASRNLKLELKNTQLALEIKSIYSQINPHFIFNTLNTGLYFIKKKRTDEAYKHISAFSSLLRAYIKSSRNKYISIGEELENLTNYILLQQTRFENKFDFEIVIHEDSLKSRKIPSLLLQPLVENALNHGLLNKENKGHLKLEFISKPNEIICIIDDDGIGREASKRINSENKTESYGSDLIKELINVFNEYEQVRINIQYIDKQEPLTGTTVVVTIQELNNE